MKVIHYINLTNGLEAIKEHGLKHYRFIRIQSSHCESKSWQKIIDYLSDDFLMNCAIGNVVIVYDYGANKKIPRSVWQGIEFIKYVLIKCWTGEEYKPRGRCKSSGKYFKYIYNSINIERIKYYRKFFRGFILIEHQTDYTVMDGDYEYYIKLSNDL